jgi:hypothetical protein
MKNKQQFNSRFCVQDYDYDDFHWDAKKIGMRWEDIPKLEFEKAYEINYKPKGFLIDECSREIYIDLDFPHELVAEDEIRLFGELYFIMDRQFDYDEKLIIYRLLRWDSDYYYEYQERNENKLVGRIEKSITNLLQSIFKNVPNGKD